MADFEIHGLEGVLEKMRTLAPKLQKGAMQRSGTKAMKIVRDAARAGAARLDDPRTASNIAKNIITRNDARRGRVEGGVVTKVGVLGGAVSKTYTNNRRNRGGRAGKSYLVEAAETFHWRFLEFGTSRQRAQPFMRPALENNVERVTVAYATKLSAEIDKAIK